MRKENAIQSRSAVDITSMDEIREFYNSHTKKEFENVRKEIKLQINDTADREIKNIFETLLKNWAETQSILVIDQISVEVSRDNLPVKYLQENQVNTIVADFYTPRIRKQHAIYTYDIDKN